MAAQLNANAVPFSPRPMYPDEYPGGRSDGYTPQTIPELARSLSAPSVCTLESDYIRELWANNTPQDHRKSSLPTDDRPLYQDDDALAAWLLSSSVVPNILSRPNTNSTARPASPVRGDVFVNGYTAQTYIPLVLRKRARADPVNCSLGHDIPWGETHLWTEPMRKGCGQTLHSTRLMQSNTVAICGPWNAQNISQLAGMVCEHAMQDSGPIPCNNALFARQLYERFLEISPLAASTFQNQLMQAAFAEFKAYWTPTMSSSILNLPTCSPYPPHAHPMHHLSCALAIASYIGDLYSLGLVRGPIVLLCLRLLIDNMTTIEQLQAIHGMLTHCGSALPFSVNIRDVFEELSANALNIAPNASSVGSMFYTDYVQQYVQGIRATFEAWEADPPTLEELENPIYPTSSKPTKLTRFQLAWDCKAPF
ncbi:hypothetical protein EUX98_g6537 [Antrodiella citrinella]|uniref:Uncharacterized protein n=1 Tax=Antrodiella citrinella TaxID=2447956 RepID=A0A4S4MQK0_9APHY|nr:hypothetical protein EUX98_g6537 [Antrodiella citrinella]